MRRVNMFLVAGILVTFMLHAVMGSMILLGGSADAMKALARVCLALIAAHIVVTGILTYRTLRAIKRSGAGYFKDNIMFWLRRLSGVAMLIPLVMHLTIFSGSNAGAYRLTAFTTGRFISQLLLVATMGLHIMTNIRPLMIAFGAGKNGRSYRADILLIISAVLLLISVAFLVYYLRWMRV